MSCQPGPCDHGGAGHYCRECGELTCDTCDCACFRCKCPCHGDES